MNEKYVLIKPYECSYGTLPQGTEIIFFRGMVYVNGGVIPSYYNGLFKRLCEDPNYVRKTRIEKNMF